MRALVVYCHPNPDSFNCAVLGVVLDRLAAAGAETQVSDLYAMRFDPVLGLDELAAYERSPQNRAPVQSEVEKLLWCDMLVFVYPTWWYGQPAMLKGWLERVLLPDVAFLMPKAEGQNIAPGLTRITRLGLFTTCGASWWLTRIIGAPGRRTLLRGVRFLCARECRTGFAAHYLMDSSSAKSRASHLKRVAAEMDRLIAAPVANDKRPAGEAVA